MKKLLLLAIVLASACSLDAIGKSLRSRVLKEANFNIAGHKFVYCNYPDKTSIPLVAFLTGKMWSLGEAPSQGETYASSTKNESSLNTIDNPADFCQVCKNATKAENDYADTVIMKGSMEDDSMGVVLAKDCKTLLETPIE